MSTVASAPAVSGRRRAKPQREAARLGARRAVGAGAGGGQQLGLGADDRHDAIADLRRRAELRHGAQQRVRDEAKLGHLALALDALRDVVAVGLGLGVGHGAEDVARGVVDPGALVEVHGMTSFRPPSWARIFFKPRRMRPLIVPIGVSSASTRSPFA